jgi:hypothetical protein
VTIVRRSGPPPRRSWSLADRLRAAYLAGEGYGSAEIAEAVGGTTPARVRAMLRSVGLSLRRSTGTDVLVIQWREGDRAVLNGTADRLDRKPADLAALVVRKALAEPGLVEKLVDPSDVVGVD